MPGTACQFLLHGCETLAARLALALYAVLCSGKACPGKLRDPHYWSESYYSKIDLAAFVLITVVPLVIEEGYYNPGRGQAYVIDLPRSITSN